LIGDFRDLETLVKNNIQTVAALAVPLMQAALLDENDVYCLAVSADET
jgi:hypothetical protein